jgi:hypothetical protein
MGHLGLQFNYIVYKNINKLCSPLHKIHAGQISLYV